MIFSVAQSINWLSVCGYPPGPRYFLDVCLSLGYRARYSAVVTWEMEHHLVFIWRQGCFKLRPSSSTASTYVCIHMYVYIYMLTPPKPTVFDFYCVLQWCLLVFAFNSSQHVFHSFEDFGCLIIMSHDASCVDTMAYFDGMCSFFDYRVVFSTKGFNSNIDRMLTALWPNVNFKLYICFYSVFIPFCDTWNFRFWRPSDLADLLFDDQYGRCFLGLFFLTM